MGFARKSAVLAATAGLLLAGCSTPAAQASSRCSSLAEPEVPGAEVVSTTAEEHPGGTIDPPPVPPDPTPPIENVPPHHLRFDKVRERPPVAPGGRPVCPRPPWHQR